MKYKNKQTYNLYKFGSYGYFHITSEKFTSLIEAINYFKKNFNAKNFRTKEIGKSYKVSGL